MEMPRPCVAFLWTFRKLLRTHFHEQGLDSSLKVRRDPSRDASGVPDMGQCFNRFRKAQLSERRRGASFLSCVECNQQQYDVPCHYVEFFVVDDDLYSLPECSGHGRERLNDVADVSGRFGRVNIEEQRDGLRDGTCRQTAGTGRP